MSLFLEKLIESVDLNDEYLQQDRTEFNIRFFNNVLDEVLDEPYSNTS